MKPSAFLLSLAGILLLAPAFYLSGPSPAPSPRRPFQAPRGADTDRVVGRPWDISIRQEKAIEKGLAWLARHQSPAGYWMGDVGFKLQNDYEVWNPKCAHVGVTSLALMAFLAAGNQPGRGKYGANVERGLNFVLSCVRPDGSIEANGTRMYSHAFSTLFLAEVYGTTRKDRVKKALQKATRFIVDAQNAEGGWRYRPKATQSDMSVTVCQVMALRAARNVGIRIPYSVIQNAVGYVRRSAVNRRDLMFRNAGLGIDVGGFKYQISHSPGEMPHRASYPLTAAGVTTLLGAGLYNDPLVVKGLRYMQKYAYTVNTVRDHYFFFYGHYYAAQAHFIVGGKWWRYYFQQVRRFLLLDQRTDGSWANRVGPGPAFGTAVACLVLLVPYQYLPIFQR